MYRYSAVENEREICKVMQQAQATKPMGGMVTLPRVCTFGIGAGLCVALNDAHWLALYA